MRVGLRAAGRWGAGEAVRSDRHSGFHETQCSHRDGGLVHDQPLRAPALCPGDGPAGSLGGGPGAVRSAGPAALCSCPATCPVRCLGSSRGQGPLLSVLSPQERTAMCCSGPQGTAGKSGALTAGLAWVSSSTDQLIGGGLVWSPQASVLSCRVGESGEQAAGHEVHLRWGASPS